MLIGSFHWDELENKVSSNCRLSMCYNYAQMLKVTIHNHCSLEHLCIIVAHRKRLDD